jgi:acetolactate synthase-1/2/3 large subunit
MLIKVSDYIAKYVVEKGITHCFTVTGGGAMHLNDSFGHIEGLKCVYQHHEQACAMAAEAYARVENRPALLCVTTGPGGTNALTGVLGAYLDSIPMIVISGQVRFDTCVRSTSLPLRSLGDQEFDITKAVTGMTKYAEMVTEPEKIKYCLDKAFNAAMSGRRGPAWLDIPMNVQGAYVDEKALESFTAHDEDNAPSEEVIDEITEKIKNAKRPVLYAGNGVRLSGAHETFLRVAGKLNIPVVTTWDGIDEIESDNPLYTGRGGNMGDRAGNFAVQNSDVLFSIGNRLSIRQVGFNYETWAREAFVIANDIDPVELKKPTIHVELPVCCDAKILLEKLDEKLDGKLFKGEDWLSRCSAWSKEYPVVTDEHRKKECNVYAVIDCISSLLPEQSICVSGNGSACVVGSQAFIIKRGGRFIVNSAVASMGYDLPAAIGAAFAAKDEIVLITGEGSIQMNLQELQTIVHHHLPIKIFLINNGGYHSIRQTQRNFFKEGLVGVGCDSGDLSFPDMGKIASAYGIKYDRTDKFSLLEEKARNILNEKESAILEIFVDTEQNFAPKSASKRLPDGRMVSAPLEDMAPFLDRDEFEKNMIIDRVDYT